MDEKIELIEKYGKKSPQVLNRKLFCDEFDLSNLDEKHTCYDKSHKKWFGVVKIEHRGLPIDYHNAPMVKCYVDRTDRKDIQRGS